MKQKREIRALKTAEKRMRMIAPLLAPSLSADTTRRLRRQLSQEYGVSERTLERYRKQYQEGGFEGLKPKGKQISDYKIPKKVLDAAIAMRREDPGRSVPSIMDQLEQEGVVPPGFLRRSTLQDALTRAGYSASTMRQYRQGDSPQSCKRRGHRNDLWLGIGEELLGSWGFYGIIDQGTGYMVHGAFYDTVGQSAVEDALRSALQAHGLPRKLYLPSGHHIQIGWMRKACQRLGIRLLHARPAAAGEAPQKSVARRFLEQLEGGQPETLDQLNQQFQNWLQEVYHETSQKETGCSPRKAFERAGKPTKQLESSMLDRAFLHRERRKVDARGYISFHGGKYLVGTHLAGQRVYVVFGAAYGAKLMVEGPGTMPVRIRMNGKSALDESE